MNIEEINYYSNESLKDSIIASLCRDCLKLLNSVYRIKKNKDIKFHYSKFKDNFPYNDPDFFELTHLIYDELLIDDVKIISAFENYFKAILLESGFIIHHINKINTPFSCNSNLKSAINIKETTFGINELLTKKFWKIYGLGESNKTYLDTIRKRRNSIHFLISKPSYPAFDVLKEIEILRPLIEDSIVVKYKEYTNKIGINYNEKLVNFEYLK